MRMLPEYGERTPLITGLFVMEREGALCDEGKGGKNRLSATF